ncbi:MAG: hypothetical protein IIV61_00305, partial [Oscillospiraceae bacterium]|nr:hypothetical protein [Oscillospiraceae bacterium]
ATLIILPSAIPQSKNLSGNFFLNVPVFVLLRQIPMDLSPEDAAEAIEALSADLQQGRHDTRDTVRDELLHTIACKAAIKAGWHTDEAELLALCKQVMAREDLKYCPHGRPICVTLSKKQLEKQFKRT